MCVLAKEKTVYVKTQSDEMCLEIDGQKVKQVSMDSELKEYSQKLTSSIMITEKDARKTRDFFGKADDGNIQVVC